MAVGKTRAALLLFLPLFCSAIRYEGDEEVTKPPQRQEFLLRQWENLEQPAEEEGRGGGRKHGSARFEQGARPTVASHSYWLTPSSHYGQRPPAAVATATSPPMFQTPPPHYGQRLSNRPPTVAPIGRGGERGQTWSKPPTVAPLRPQASPAKETVTTAPLGHRGPSGVGYRGLFEEAETTTPCTGRGHSWGCEGGPGALGGSEGETESFRVAPSVARRELQNGRGAGWIAPKDWCLLPTGQFPYPLDCRRFVNCWNGRGFIQPCAPGTLFNADTLECDFPSKVKNCQPWGHGSPGGGRPHQGPGAEGDLAGAASSSSGKLVSDVVEGAEEEEEEEDYGEGDIDVRLDNRQGRREHHATASREIATTTPRTIVAPRRNFAPAPRTTATPITTATPRTIASTTIRHPKAFHSRMSCPEANGIFPHPEFCDRFVNCHAGRPHSIMCGPGTLFDARNKRCDYARNVKCHLANTPIISGSPQEEWEEELTPAESRHHPAPAGIPPPRPTPRESVTSTPSTPPPVTSAPTPRREAMTTPRASGGTRVSKEEGRSSTSHHHHQPRPPSAGHRPHATTTQAVPPAVAVPWEAEEGPRTPPTGQSLRLRGGAWPWEGYLEVHAGGGRWSPVCDSGRWTLAEGNVVCRQLGYHRGADITWKGHLSHMNASGEAAFIVKVECRGQEQSLTSCRLGNAGRCDLTRDSVAVRCLKEYRSLCSINEVPYGGHCYSLVMFEERSDRKHQVRLQVPREIAAEECQRRGGSLAHISTQEENNFISEWLLHRHPDVLLLMTDGVSIPMGYQNVWMWESSQFALTYSNWWNGWEGRGPVSNSGRCVVMSRMFDCPGDGQHTHPSLTLAGQSSPRRQCKTDYHFWSTHECTTPTHGAICKRNPNDIGCVWKLGMDYIGQANVTRHGNSCIPWDSGPFGSPHPDVRLNGHNLCRNHGGADGGGAAEGHPWCYVDPRGGWESCEIPPCRDSERERSAAGGARGGAGAMKKEACRADEFDCGEQCIPNDYVCDGLKDCSNGKDEGVECKGGGLLKEFRRRGGTRHREAVHGPLEKWVQVTAKECATHCLGKERDPHHCTAFSYHLKDQQCLLVASKKKDHSDPELETKLGWDHYELLPPSVNCRGMFHCKNGTCIDSNKVCNGMNDCGDRSDEVNCSSDAVGFSLRLVGGSAPHEGRIEVKAFGRWGVVCDDLFGLADADVVCREAGFTLGAAEVVPHSGFGSGVIKGPPLFLMDEVECAGTERSLSECQFPGWGDHNCGPEEVAGVVCKIPGSACQDDQFHCLHSKECIPLEYLCDNLKDCEDGSDEDPVQCQSEVLVRLAGGLSNHEGRVEVRYNGIWGTVCDDDFGVTDAQVICRSLGLGWGPDVQALKEAHYGPGKGPIWLDELHCSGQEEKLIDCPRFPWGKSNCGHKEDASVKCTPRDHRAVMAKPSTTPVSRITTMKQGHFPVSAEDILPSGCEFQSNSSVWMKSFGVRGSSHPNALQQQPKVIGGKEFQLGPIPWQAGLRVRSLPGKSVHWCGAVVLSPRLALTAGHCIQDYSKEAYILRVGDYDSKLDEGTEQEVSIEDVYLHEDFNKGPYLNNDIAVLKLKAPGIRFGDQVHGVCLPSAERVGLDNDWGRSPKECIISGWGSVSSGVGFSRTLRSAVIPLLSQSVCRAAHVYGEEAIGDGMGCAGSLSEGGADSCQGDSGGPLVCFDEGNKPVLWAITSWGQGCGRANKPGVYSRVSYHREWIDKKVLEAMSGM